MMADGKVYLKPNVAAEPPFDRWYAWSSPFAPAAAAMFVANSHPKTMQSFVSSPQVHANALKVPAMRGGPFINYEAGRVPEVKRLFEATVTDLALLGQNFRAALRPQGDLPVRRRRGRGRGRGDE